MKDGDIIVRVALEKGPRDIVEEGDWTDLTDRVKAYSDDRGRDDVLQPFGPGTAQVLLKNHDRALDPSNPDGLLFNGADEPIGLPLCPVKITQWWDGVEYPKFRGFLGPEAWPGDVAPYGESGTVTLYVMDALGHSPQLPRDIWGIATAELAPDWWSRMDELAGPILDVGALVPNSIGSGAGEIEGTPATAISRPFTRSQVPSGFGVNDPGLRLSGDHLVRFPAADIMPDGDEDKFTVWLWWSDEGVGEIPSGDTAKVMEMVHPLTGIRRWSVYVDGNDGLAYVTTFDAAGDEVDSDSIDPSIVGFSRWDAGQPHHVVAVWDAGGASNLTVWFGGVSATLSIPGDLYESDLIIGPADVDTLFDEVTVWRRALSYMTDLVPVFMAGGFGSMWAGDTWADRLGRWVEATGRETDADITNQWHLPDDGNRLWGLLRPERSNYEDAPGVNYSVTLPDTLADAFQMTVANGGGACWATKDGYLRARTIHALTDPTWSEHYAEPCTFTDDPTILDTAGTYRHAGVQVTGLRIDRIINAYEVSFLYTADEPPEVDTSTYLTYAPRDQASVDRYELRRQEHTSEWAGWELNYALADQMIERYAQPHQEIESIRLDPTGDDASTEVQNLRWFLITQLELELACEVTYTSAGADPVTIPDLNIQHIHTEWTPERWFVDVVAAKS